MPNGQAQAELIRSVYESAGLDPRDTGYVEAHGTGTKVGDPIEAEALHSVFGPGREPKDPLYMGSIKSNIGHAEGSSGILAIIKTALMLEKGFILPNIHFKKANEAIPLAKWNMKVRHVPGSSKAPLSPSFCYFYLFPCIRRETLTRMNDNRYPRHNFRGRGRRSTPASTTSDSEVRTATSSWRGPRSRQRRSELPRVNRRVLASF